MTKRRRIAPRVDELYDALRMALREIERLGGHDNDEETGERNPTVDAIEALFNRAGRLARDKP
jgi:hypothetical protein